MFTVRATCTKHTYVTGSAAPRAEGTRSRKTHPLWSSTRGIRRVVGWMTPLAMAWHAIDVLNGINSVPAAAVVFYSLWLLAFVSTKYASRRKRVKDTSHRGEWWVLAWTVFTALAITLAVAIPRYEVPWMLIAQYAIVLFLFVGSETEKRQFARRAKRSLTERVLDITQRLR